MTCGPFTFYVCNTVAKETLLYNYESGNLFLRPERHLFCSDQNWATTTAASIWLPREPQVHLPAAAVHRAGPAGSAASLTGGGTLWSDHCACRILFPAVEDLYYVNSELLWSHRHCLPRATSWRSTPTWIIVERTKIKNTISNYSPRTGILDSQVAPSKSITAP